MDYPLIGNHPSLKKIRELVSMVSDMGLNVLILGETGTGKEVVARLLHNSSSRRKKRFIKVNCAALPLTLLESELFGYEKGAFTGAGGLKPGKFELASGGVIFLDEIGDIPMVVQAKLLSVLQSGEFYRLGGTANIISDAWVITSTNHDLDKDIKQGLFREDLFYRLNIIKIEMPPLREIREDIPLLISHFMSKHMKDLKLDDHFSVDQELLDLFHTYHWPGNVRELSGVVLRLILEDDVERIKSDLLNNMKADGLAVTFGTSDNGPVNEYSKVKSLKKVKAETSQYIEKKTIMHVLKITAGNKSEAARMLNISYKTLFTKMHDLGIES
jgi:two-component system response regulator AtoC